MELEDYLVTRFARAIRSWPPSLVEDIYALSVYRDDNNSPYRPGAYLLYNTISHARTSKPGKPDDAEARWNLAYWQMEDWVGIEGWRGKRDEEGAWALSAWLLPVEQQYGDDSDAVIDAFAALCVRVARRLHTSGVIRDVFGRDIPIIMHDDEWDDDIVRNTEAANPPGVAREFLEALPI